MNNKDDVKRIIILLVIGVLGYLTISNFEIIYKIVIKLLDALVPFILGLVIAFILNIPMKKIEAILENLQKNKTKKIPIRGISIALSLIIFLLVIAFIIAELLPDLISNIETLINNIPTILKDVENFALNIVKGYPDVQEKIKEVFLNTANVDNILVKVLNYIVNGSISFVTNFVNSVVAIFTGIVFAVYMLSQKEKLISGTKKTVNAYLGKRKSDKIFEIGKLANYTFSRFVSGQCLESVILGCIFFIVLTILRYPYALLIAVLTSITSLIPFFGAFIAMVIGAILIATQSFTKAIIFIILFLVIQQIENNLIYPKVVGKSVGLSPIWTLLAITVGGSLFGIVGMIIGLPIASIIYALLKKDVNNKIKHKTKEEINV